MHRSLKTVHPAQLWLGNLPHLMQETHLFFKSLWCPNAICNSCITCIQISTHQHPSFIWIEPINGYTLDTIAPIKEYISLQRTLDEPFFFVLSRADFLTPAVGSALLKSLEEPPTGYFFLLLAERKQLLLPTIISRCLINYKLSTKNLSTHTELYTCFIKKTDPITFFKILEKSKINERESIDLLDELLEYFIREYKTTLSTKTDIQKSSTPYILPLLEDASRFCPMPGSSKLFWKNLFLQIYSRY